MFVFGKFGKTVRLGPPDVSLDNMVFRLHYRLTFWFLLAACLLVSTREFIREHINCLTGDSKLQKVINTYCFFSATFTVVKYHNESYVDSLQAAHFGVAPYTGKEEIIRHAYYQWVPFVLLGQALLFAAPHYIWRHLEGRRLEMIVHFMRTSVLTSHEPKVIKGQAIDSKDSRQLRVDWLKTSYLSLNRFRVNRDWANSLCFCELLNLLNLILQVILVQEFLQGKFLELGWDWWFGEQEALDDVFPKVTKCIFHKYGASGTIQKHDAICVMALNIINEKIYCMLWFWFFGLMVLTFGGLIWRLLTVTLHSRSEAFNRWVWGEISPGPSIDPRDVTVITENLCFQDWLFLYYLGKNMKGSMFRDVVSHLSRQMQNRKHRGKYQPRVLDISSEEDPLQTESFC